MAFDSKTSRDLNLNDLIYFYEARFYAYDGGNDRSHGKQAYRL